MIVWNCPASDFCNNQTVLIVSCVVFLSVMVIRLLAYFVRCKIGEHSLEAFSNKNEVYGNMKTGNESSFCL